MTSKKGPAWVSIFGSPSRLSVVPGDRLYGPPLHCMFFPERWSLFSKHREFVSRAFITMVMDAEAAIVIFCADDVQCRFMDRARKT